MVYLLFYLSHISPPIPGKENKIVNTKRQRMSQKIHSQGKRKESFVPFKSINLI